MSDIRTINGLSVDLDSSSNRLPSSCPQCNASKPSLLYYCKRCKHLFCGDCNKRLNNKVTFSLHCPSCQTTSDFKRLG
jgi:hypothetical protein